ncbi:uncharacterized protein BKA55DRAFT_504451 [Fusarium redolens]|uniref:Uncharacterized protein n=1 Tax=Fusarium redolens TaxID=48865 RepID=A0A9P9HPF8_FUSRE|nr:uncharacterized protein BKA55DRAFT_504451 [Fusarium redolens]KAH7260916.1 hypothetical protein BKA55DRAFT_504451 [Fusarium redolens]
MIFPAFVANLEDIYNTSSSSSSAGPSEISDQVVEIGFPQIMQLTWTPSPSTMALFISETGSYTLYAACMPRGWQGPTYLFPGSSVAGDPISSAIRSGDGFIFQLPGIPSCNTPSNQVTMTYHRSRSNPRYSFSMRVEHGGGRRTESFEWRVSAEAQSSTYSLVWELVSLGRTSKSGSHRSRSSEVVAMIHEDNVSSVSVSVQRSGGFQFLGRATTGSMGYHWTVMALMSSIAILQDTSRE